MSPNIAKLTTLGMCIVSLCVAVLNTFFEQDYIGAIIGITATSMFYYVHRNPELMMAKSWEEFCEQYDNSRDKKYMWGFPAFHAVMLAAILYIWLV